ncbi:MAG: CTP synthase, partial [Pseudomonadota bacterium]
KTWLAIGEDEVDFMLCEIGGTVGDIEGLPFFEAIRQFAQDRPRGQAIFVHLTLLPYIAASRELKTKPTQHSVKELRSIGIAPDVLVCRTEHPIPEKEREKIALFCNVRAADVIPAMDLKSIYEAPLAYHAVGLDQAVLDAFGITPAPRPQLKMWEDVVSAIHNPDGEVKIAIVGKYTQLEDAYKSIAEALTHGGIANRVRVQAEWLDAEIFERENPAPSLEGFHGIIVPGGFGERGTEGMVRAAEFARTRSVPYLGICLGMQMAVIEAARNLAGMADAGSEEFDHEAGLAAGTRRFEPVVYHLKEWVAGNRTERRSAHDAKGGTMRLGAYRAALSAGSQVAAIYGNTAIEERHRHRYEVDVQYRESLEACGLSFSGMSPDGRLPEIVEVHDHPWFVGVQFHPELKSKPFEPHPLFRDFVRAALEQSRLV